MQLSIRAKGPDVKAISYLLSKNPNNLYERNVNGHDLRMFYSKFTEEEVEVTFYVSPDSINLTRNQSQQYDITSYINDREFVVSSIFISLLRPALGTALNGRPKEAYIQWVNHPFPLEFTFGPLASNLPDKVIKNLFEPLGYDVEIAYGEVDYNIQLKTKSSARFITIKGVTTLQMGLRQLFVLIPVLDNYKHYYIDEKEIEKIERYGEGWLEQHPLRDYIVRQALRFKEVYRLFDSSQLPVEEAVEGNREQESTVRLNDLRYEKIIQIVREQKWKGRIVDFGSGEGKLAVKLGFVSGVKEIFAVEPSQAESKKAGIRFDKAASKDNFIMPQPLFGSLFYYDERLVNVDIMILCEVIEHIDEHRLPKIMEMILKRYRPKTIIITTPNREYNAVYELNESYRHLDHRFEWTREQFSNWCVMQIEGSDYEVSFDGIGKGHEVYGYPTQLCVFTRKEL